MKNKKRASKTNSNMTILFSINEFGGEL